MIAALPKANLNLAWTLEAKMTGNEAAWFAAAAAALSAIAAIFTFWQAKVANSLASVSTLDVFLERARFYQDAWVTAFLSEDKTEIALKRTDLFNHLETSALALNNGYYPRGMRKFIQEVVLGTVASFEFRSDISSFAENDTYGGMFRNLVLLCRKNRKEIDRMKTSFEEIG